jgi:cytochrome c553|tara:strand:- start:760 stop:1425 length:666 start_codon:yes stop_codon:yes gene_type:complete
MKYSLIFFIFFGLAIEVNAADDQSKKVELPETFISGDATKGSQLVESCAACHGADGNSISTDWPKLSGQNQRYLYEQLMYFRDGDRMNALMMSVTPYLQTLSDDDLKNIAAFYSQYKTTVGQAKNDEELLSLGTQLYRFGNIKKQIPACTSCHAVYGQGNSLAGYPAVSGQQIGYLTSSLKAYRSKERNSGESSIIMQSIAENLTDYEIEALANYMHGLYQ